jgi:hypothetical protein
MAELLNARKACLARGIRTIGWTFWGGGDDGSLQEMCIPEHAALSLADCIEQDGNARQWDAQYPHQLKGIVLPPIGQLVGSQEKAAFILNLPSAQYQALEALIYKILDHFPGDWVNNEGGGGAVGVDLLTLAWNIDGYQNVQSTEDVATSGDMGEDTDPGDEEDDYVILSGEITPVDVAVAPLDMAALIAKELEA